jgi:uncharacterized membrane protein YtjA (UPF0391 family)
MGIVPQLFTKFGVWPRSIVGAMVNVQMRFAHRFDPQGSTINRPPAAGEAKRFPAAANSAGCEDQQNDEHKNDAGRAERLLNGTTEREPGGDNPPSLPGGEKMLYYALVFFIIAVIAGLLGFGVIASAAAGIAKILFFVFLVLFIVTLIGHASRGRTV